MSLLLTKAEKNSQVTVTINSNGIFYQEFRLGSRPMSKRVKIGSLQIVDGDVLPTYGEWLDFDRMSSEVSSLERLIEVMKTAKQDTAAKQKERDRLADLLITHPLHSLTGLTAIVAEMVDKLVNSAKFKHQLIAYDGKDGVCFTAHETQESFIEFEARQLCKRFNESHDDQLMPIAEARSIVEARYQKYLAASGKRAKVAA